MQTPDWQKIHNEKAQSDTQYVASMDPSNGPREGIEVLANTLAATSKIFEYGTGPGANAIYLAEKGHKVSGQDVSDYMGKIFQENVSRRELIIPLEICSAQEHIPSENYDAFVSAFVLLMPREDALMVIERMQKFTNPGGYNLLNMFMAGSSIARPERFYPTREEILDIYKDWAISREKIGAGKNTKGQEIIRMSILARKTENT